MTSFTPEQLFVRPLPLFLAECFGSAFVARGRFVIETGVQPAPALLSFEEGKWFVNHAWAGLVREELSQQSGAWVLSFVLGVEKSIWRDIENARMDAPAEVVAHDLCELFGSMASPTMVHTLLLQVLEPRVRLILEHAGIAGEERGSWVELFRYPSQLTETMREREAFLRLADEVRKRPMDRSTRMVVGAYVRRFGHVGRMSGLGRAWTFEDIMKRVAQIDGDPKMIETLERHDRETALKRVDEFMDTVGLAAADRDIIRAYRDIHWLSLRLYEAWAHLSRIAEDAARRLGAAADLDSSLVLSLRPEEMPHALDREPSAPSVEELVRRAKGKLRILFVEDMVEVEVK